MHTGLFAVLHAKRMASHPIELALSELIDGADRPNERNLDDWRDCAGAAFTESLRATVFL
jgi:hypothetical protein